MTTITIDRTLLEQALDALNCCYSEKYDGAKFHGAKAALRAALAAQQPAPAWNDVPTCSGVWVNAAELWAFSEGEISGLRKNGRWFGPLPEDTK